MARCRSYGRTRLIVVTDIDVTMAVETELNRSELLPRVADYDEFTNLAEEDSLYATAR